MAEATPVSKVYENLSKHLVQELSQRGDEIPEKYIQKEGIQEAIDAPDELWNDTLLIDFSLLSSSDDNEMAKLKAALSNWGCFQVKNHGMERSFLEDVIEVSKEFFALPLEEKIKSSGNNTFQGYGSDSVSIIDRTSWNDQMYLTLLPEEKRNLHLWPQNPPKFRKLLDEFIKKLPSVLEDIYMAMSRSLELEDDFFLNLMKGGVVLGRLTMYPPCPCPERVIGLEPHTDGTMITALLVEPGVEGLQVEKDGQWFKVPTIPGSLLVVVGDLGQMMTNKIFKSVLHRVVTNSAKARISWSAFCAPGDDIEIGPISKLISDAQPQLYKKMNMMDYKQKYVYKYSAGRRTPINEEVL